MTVGALGSVAFEVSDSFVQTVKSLTWSGSASYSTHARHGLPYITEFVGVEPEKLSFDMYLNAYLGADPQDAFRRLRSYMGDGSAVSFVLGSRRYGSYRWNITSLSMKSERFDAEGNLVSATVSVSLQEYLEE